MELEEAATMELEEAASMELEEAASMAVPWSICSASAAKLMPGVHLHCPSADQCGSQLQDFRTS